MMIVRIGLAAALAMLPIAALAQTVPVTFPNFTNSAGAPRPAPLVLDPNNAPFSVASGPLAAGTNYAAQGFRAVNVTCTSAGSANLTLSGGGSIPITFGTGASYQLGFSIASIDAVPSGCTFYGIR